MPQRLKIVFFGSDAIALPLLDWLAAEGASLGEIAAVFTQPNRPSGRGREIRPNAIKTWAAGRSLPVLQPDRIGPDDHRSLAAIEPDLGLVMAYGHILRDDFLAIPRLGMLNLHASLLPRYRGASPVQAAIASGDRQTGVTLMRIIRRLDAGPIADSEKVPILPLDTAAEVEARLAAACVPLLARALPQLGRGDLRFEPQDDGRASFCRKLAKEDGALDFSAPAAALAARINGLFPWPGCGTEVAGASLRIGLADVAPARAGAIPGEPGTVLGADADGLLVTSGAGVLRLRKFQRPGGRLLPAGEFLRGFPIPAGTRLASRPMSRLVESQPA